MLVIRFTLLISSFHPLIKDLLHSIAWLLVSLETETPIKKTQVMEPQVRRGLEEIMKQNYWADLALLLPRMCVCVGGCAGGYVCVHGKREICIWISPIYSLKKYLVRVCCAFGIIIGARDTAMNKWDPPKILALIELTFVWKYERCK